MQQGPTARSGKRKHEETLSTAPSMELDADPQGQARAGNRTTHAAGNKGASKPTGKSQPPLDNGESTATLLADNAVAAGFRPRTPAGEVHREAANGRPAQPNIDSDYPANRAQQRDQTFGASTVSPTYTTVPAVDSWQTAEQDYEDAGDFAGSVDSFAPSVQAPHSAPPRVTRKEVKLGPGQSKLCSVLESDNGRLAGSSAPPSLRIDTVRPVASRAVAGPFSAPPVHQNFHNLPPLPIHQDRVPVGPPQSRRQHEARHAPAPNRPSAVSRAQSDGMAPTKPSKYVGPYELTQTLGAGSVGEVKMGVHKETGQRVAIKIVPKEEPASRPADPKQPAKPKKSNRDKLEREVAIMKLIKHPNVLELYDVYETEHHLYLVLELVEGGELFDYLVQRGRLPEHEALRFFQQIIGGLSYCHSHLVCHRDLKPENLLLNPTCDEVKIADFGMANLQLPSRLLQTSCGSPHYAAPEVIRGIRYDGALADIWSCGVILYALLTGGLPFDDPDIKKLLAKVKNGAYVIPGREICSNQCQDLLSRMLTVDPTQRIQMKDILRHPFFLSRTPSPTSVSPVSLRTNTWTERINNVDSVLIKQLSILGWGTTKEIEAKLVSDEACLDKAFYTLLLQRQKSSAVFREASMASLKGSGALSKQSSQLAMQLSGPSAAQDFSYNPAPAIPPAAATKPRQSSAKYDQPPAATSLRITIPTVEERTAYSEQQAWEGTTPRFHRPAKKPTYLASDTSTASFSSPKRSWFANLFFGSNSKPSYGSDFHFTPSPSASSASDTESSVSDISNGSQNFAEFPFEPVYEKIRVSPGPGISEKKMREDVEQLLLDNDVSFELVPEHGALRCTIPQQTFTSARLSYDGNGDAKMQDAIPSKPASDPNAVSFVVQIVRASAGDSVNGAPSYIGGLDEDKEMFSVEMTPLNEQSKKKVESFCKELRLRWNVRRPVAEEESSRRSARSASTKIGRELRRLVNVGREMIGQPMQ